MGVAKLGHLVVWRSHLSMNMRPFLNAPWKFLPVMKLFPGNLAQMFQKLATGKPGSTLLGPSLCPKCVVQSCCSILFGSLWIHMQHNNSLAGLSCHHHSMSMLTNLFKCDNAVLTWANGFQPKSYKYHTNMKKLNAKLVQKTMLVVFGKNSINPPCPNPSNLGWGQPFW